jgi:glycosyltransferase involved in cell wall biosynthesis
MPSLKIAYALQNAGSVKLDRDWGDSVPVKYTLRGLTANGHCVRVLMRKEGRVLAIDDHTQPDNTWQLPAGLPQMRAFRWAEFILRRLQQFARLPYFAVIDSYRFYDGLRRVLPAFDLCHEHSGLFSVGAALACRRTGCPYVLTFGGDAILEAGLAGSPLKGLHLRAARRAAAYTFRRADAILCVSEAAKGLLSQQYGVDPGKIFVLPNGVDLAHFERGADPAETRRRLGLGSDPVIGFAGSFRQWHGLDLLLESFSCLLADEPSARLLLVGDGPARGALEAQIDRLRLAGRVVITGFVPQAQVPDYLHVLDVAALPYPHLQQEIWFSPLKMFEYMAAGRAIVASRAGQIASVLEDGRTGVLVKPGDTAELTAALLALIRSPERRAELGGLARQAAAGHSWEQYIRRLETIYDHALAAHRNQDAELGGSF